MSKLWNTKHFQHRLLIMSSRSQPHNVPPAMPGHKGHRVAGFLVKCAKYFTNTARDRNYIQLVCS